MPRLAWHWEDSPYEFIDGEVRAGQAVRCGVSEKATTRGCTCAGQPGVSRVSSLEYMARGCRSRWTSIYTSDNPAVRLPSHTHVTDERPKPRESK